MIRFDHYAEEVWHRAVPVADRVRIRQALTDLSLSVPHGVRMSVTHGGGQYTASLITNEPLEIVARESRPRIVAACDAVLSPTVVTVDAAGYITDLS